MFICTSYASRYDDKEKKKNTISFIARINDRVLLNKQMMTYYTKFDLMYIQR